MRKKVREFQDQPHDWKYMLVWAYQAVTAHDCKYVTHLGRLVPGRDKLLLLLQVPRPEKVKQARGHLAGHPVTSPQRTVLGDPATLEGARGEGLQGADEMCGVTAARTAWVPGCRPWPRLGVSYH